ncbi:uncharacterized protein LOC123321325 [Coccinella septempunctata]|uniref:uncharacterized protein LOC123321325 n=1 Tax=Coccinella septempunctata TaxID=41139 RepID=UPI001D096E40|nr:uncharacterized protein LOC123321325 [Coccinella septempunctata]
MIHHVKRAKRLLLLFQMLVRIKAAGNDTTEEILLADEVKQNESTINPEIATTISQNLDQETTMNLIRKHIGRGLPTHFHFPESRWGPFFEEGSDPMNLTARVGSTIILDCRIGLLQDKTVTWSHHKGESFHLLTVGKGTYSNDERITLSFRYPNNFRLQIVYVTRRDQGLYECQVATHPPKVKRIFLTVIAPEVVILDEAGREVTERYYRAGSHLELICTAQQLQDSISSSEPPLLWKHDDRVLSKGISYNVSAATNSATSTLMIAPLKKQHSGNYTCAVGNWASSNLVVHVLNGELPAAVHSGEAASRILCKTIVVLGFLLTIGQR